MLKFSGSPASALSWKIGPSGPVGPDGHRLPADVWCAVGLYRESDEAKSALQLREQFMPFLANASESWHALLMPVAHKGECNHLDRDHPGALFDDGLHSPRAREVSVLPGAVLEKTLIEPAHFEV